MALRGVNVQIPDELAVNDKALGFIFARSLRLVHIDVVDQLAKHRLTGIFPRKNTAAVLSLRIISIESAYRHDFKYCGCGRAAVSGGRQGIVPVIPIVSRYFCAFML